MIRKLAIVVVCGWDGFSCFWNAPKRHVSVYPQGRYLLSIHDTTVIDNGVPENREQMG